jgi:predicted RNase H-like HicB family nuclease
MLTVIIWSKKMRCAIVVEKAGNNNSAYVPDLPRCFATGNTVKEAGQEILKAIKFHIDGLRKDGLPVPAPSSVVEYLEIAA